MAPVGLAAAGRSGPIESRRSGKLPRRERAILQFAQSISGRGARAENSGGGRVARRQDARAKAAEDIKIAGGCG